MIGLGLDPLENVCSFLTNRTSVQVGMKRRHHDLRHLIMVNQYYPTEIIEAPISSGKPILELLSENIQHIINEKVLFFFFNQHNQRESLNLKIAMGSLY